MTVDASLAEQHYAEHSEQAVLRRPGRLHHRRPARRAGAGGPRGGDGRPPADRRHQPARGRARLDPRRLRRSRSDEPRPRLRLPRVGRARDRPLLPGARLAGATSSSPPARRSGGRSSSSSASTSRRGPDGRGADARATRASWSRERLRKARAVGGELVLAWTRGRLDGRVLGKPADAAEARSCSAAVGREHEVMGGMALRRDGEEHRVAVHQRALSRLTDADVAGTWQRRVARPRRRLRDPGARRGARGGIDGDYLERRRAAGAGSAAAVRTAPGLFGARALATALHLRSAGRSALHGRDP